MQITCQLPNLVPAEVKEISREVKSQPLTPYGDNCFNQKFWFEITQEGFYQVFGLNKAQGEQRGGKKFVELTFCWSFNNEHKSSFTMYNYLIKGTFYIW